MSLYAGIEVQINAKGFNRFPSCPILLVYLLQHDNCWMPSGPGPNIKPAHCSGAGETAISDFWRVREWTKQEG